MRKLISLFGGLACLYFVVTNGPVQAAAWIAYVSPAGTDSGDCSVATSPCRQIYYAILQVQAAGVVVVAPGDYGPFALIDKAVDVIATNRQAVVNAATLPPPDGGPVSSVVIGSSAARGPIRLVGLTINAGAGISISGNTPRVLIEDCYISADGGYGIDLRATAGTPMLYVRHTHLDRALGASSGGGLRVRSTVGTRVTLEDVFVENNIRGITIDGTINNGVNKVIIRNSTSVAADTYGLQVIDSGAGSSSVKIEGSEISSNTNQGIAVSGANAVVRIADSSISLNGRGVQVAAGGQIISQGGNVLAGNNVDGAFTASFPLK